MSELINKKSLEHLATLARIDLGAHEETKMLKDVEAILEHFQELRNVPTEGIAPMTGGTSLTNQVREDVNVTKDTGKGPEAFPDVSGGYLKVPPVF